MQKGDKQSCAVPTCTSDRTVQKFQFLSNRTRGSLWLSAVKYPILSALCYEEILKGRYCVCHLHFAPGSKTVSGKGKHSMRSHVVPSLNLPEDVELPLNLVTDNLDYVQSTSYKVTEDLEINYPVSPSLSFSKLIADDAAYPRLGSFSIDLLKVN